MGNKKKMDVEEIARKHALINAIKFDGKASLKAVIGKVMAEVKGDAKEIIKIVRDIVEEVNKLSLEEQKNEIERLGIEIKEEKRRKEIKLPPLPNAEKGEVVTRFPPEPNGYLHIGHAKAAIIDHEYARMYDGIFILRFDDTNPINERKEFYDAQKEDLKWLGIDWDKEYRTSDNLPKHYELAKELLDKGCAYICTCKEEEIKRNRKLGKECACRNRKEQPWDEFFKMKEGEAVLRLKGDMKSKNTAMRDPILFRIIEHPHPIHGNRFRVWPTYDFYGAIEDSISGVTHPFRTKEYELRDEVYFYLLDCLELRKPHLMEFSRLSIKGMPVSKRKLKPLVEKKLVWGWDDPRLPTLRGLARRGILAEAMKEFVLSQGISKSESVIAFENLEAVNRKLLDGRAKRLFFVPQPVKLIVENAPEKEAVLKYHPSVDMGVRKIKIRGIFYIPQDDAVMLKEGSKFRLKDLYNVVVKEKGSIIKGEFAGEKLLPIPKIQWVSDEKYEMNVIVPMLPFKNGEFDRNSLKIVKGFVEKNIEEIKHGEIVQFERFGFVRIEKNGGIKGIRAHA
ncbi:MAG: glutamate--tRNA ligase [Thermoplasmata archaeon]|nr:MAG: glutamate--tRNA ligase [Thermoplasmata archaeon]